MLLQFLGAGVVLGAVGLLVWMGFRSARQAGAAEARETEAKHAVDNAERIVGAVADAPRDAGELDDRVRGRDWKL